MQGLAGEAVHLIAQAVSMERIVWAVMDENGLYYPARKGKWIDVTDTKCGRPLQLFFLRDEAEKVVTRLREYRRIGNGAGGFRVVEMSLSLIVK